jgi:hypothetical protein
VARLVKGLVAVVGAALVLGATAHAAQYKGEIKGEPDASLKLTIKNIEGSRYLTRVEFKKLPVECEGGQNLTSGDASAGKPGEPGIMLEGGAFKGPWDFGRITGERRGGGKIAGTITLKTDEGPPTGECKTGELRYVVRER